MSEMMKRKRLGWITLADVHAVLRREIKIADLARERGVDAAEVRRAVMAVDPGWKFNAVAAETIRGVVDGLVTVGEVAAAYRLHPATIRKMVNEAAPELARRPIVRKGVPTISARQPEAAAA
jgi:hypothetical protein